MRDYELSQRTIGQIIGDKASRCPERTFLLCEGRTYTYADLDEMTNRYANGFAALGIGKGDHVAIIMSNCAEHLWTVWGLGKLGAVAVPLNTAAKGELLKYFLTQSDSVVLVVDDEFWPRAAEVLSSAPGLRTVVVRGDLPDDVPSSLAAHPITDLDVADPATPHLDEPVVSSDLHLIMYTSGTTGPSKGVMCPHSQGHAVGRQMASLNEYRSDDVLFTCLPVFHANALWFTVYAALWAEASVALYPHFSASRFWDQIRESRATVFNALGAMANIIWQLPRSERDRDHHVRTCMMVPNSAELSHGFADRYGIRVTSVYAMTENCAVCVFTPFDPPDKAPSAGRVRPDVSVRIVADDGTALPTGEVGEILIRPNEPGMITSGYYQLPNATTEAMRDLWFHTGDRGYLDMDDYLYFTDRKKDAIRRRGENISGYEVETIICRHPAIAQAAAVAVPSDLSEDDVAVYLVIAENAQVGFEEIIDFCIANMAYFMVPRYLTFIDELPKTASEKIEKYKLKSAAAENLAAMWDREAAGIKVRR